MRGGGLNTGRGVDSLGGWMGLSSWGLVYNIKRYKVYIYYTLRIRHKQKCAKCVYLK